VAGCAGSPFGALLRQLRVAAGLTQEELAASARLSPRSVSDLERGISRSPRPETVRRLAAALGLGERELAEFRAAAAGRQPGRGEETLAWAVEGGLGDRVLADPGLAAVRALPRDVAGFTGRAEELGVLTGPVADAAASGGVVGICAIGGLAGMGKTTLAVHAAHLLADRFPDGQLFVQLHAHTPGRRAVDPADALASLLRVAGYSEDIPSDLDSRAACWRSFLAGRKVLVVLDDADGHEQVGPLLPGMQGSLVIVTSRRRLAGLTDAAAISLDTLPAADAARLLATTAGRPGLSADDPEVAQIIRLCGYLPLAIAMAGSQLRHHPAWTAAHLAGLLAAARDRPGLLAAGNLSVAAAFDLSYRDLSAAQRRLFRALGLHPCADFNDYAAAALAGTSLSAASRALTALYDEHLITEHVPGRYRMHDLLRAHARALADFDDPAASAGTITRLLDYYLDAAQAAGGYWSPWFEAAYDFTPRQVPGGRPALSTQDQASAWMADELANLFAAAGHAAGSGMPAYAVAIAAIVNGYLRFQGRPHDHVQPLVRLHESILASARRVGDRATLAFAHLMLAGAQVPAMQNEAAEASALEALALFRELGDLSGQADALVVPAMICHVTSEYAAAVDYLGRILGLRHASGDRSAEAGALNDLAAIYWYTGDYEAAESLFRQALAIFRDIGNLRGEGFSLGQLAPIWLITGRYRAARAALEQARAIHCDLGDSRHAAGVLVSLASYYRLTGDHPAAAASIEQAIRELGDIGDAPLLAIARNELGLVQQLAGDYDAAAANHQAAMRKWCDIGDRIRQAETLNNLGELSLRIDDTGQAGTHYEKALGLARTIGSPLEEARALEGLGRSELQAGRSREAAALLTQALAVFQRLGAARATAVSLVLHSIEAGEGSVAAALIDEAR